MENLCLRFQLEYRQLELHICEFMFVYMCVCMMCVFVCVSMCVYMHFIHACAHVHFVRTYQF